MCSPLSVSIVIKVRLRNKEKQRSLKAKKQITSNIKEAGSLESVFSLFLNDKCHKCLCQLLDVVIPL